MELIFFPTFSREENLTGNVYSKRPLEQATCGGFPLDVLYIAIVIAIALLSNRNMAYKY